MSEVTELIHIVLQRGAKALYGPILGLKGFLKLFVGLDKRLLHLSPSFSLASILTDLLLDPFSRKLAHIVDNPLQFFTFRLEICSLFLALFSQLIL